MSMLALLLEFTSKCKNYCRIITDYASFSMEIQHLVHLHRHICVIEALKSQTSRENLTLQEMRTQKVQILKMSNFVLQLGVGYWKSNKRSGMYEEKIKRRMSPQ